MTTIADLSAAILSAQTDAALLRAIVQGPATGEDSIVALSGGAEVKTLARIVAEEVTSSSVPVLDVAEDLTVDASHAGYELWSANGDTETPIVFTFANDMPLKKRLMIYWAPGNGQPTWAPADGTTLMPYLNDDYDRIEAPGGKVECVCIANDDGHSAVIAIMGPMTQG